MIRKLSIFAVFLVLLGSIGLNVALYRFAEAQYREVRQVRLDPSSERRFVAANAALEPAGDGVARVVFFGDSRIALWDDLPQSPGTQLVNRGRGGETTQQMLLRLERDVIDLAPDVVVLQAGVNDLTTLPLFPHRAAEIIENCRKNLDAMIARMQAARIRVVVMTILPAGTVTLGRRPMWSETTRDAIDQINRALRSTDRSGTGSVVVDCDPVIARGQWIKPDYERDTVHINARGYEALNALIEPVLARLVAGGSGPG